MSVKVMGQVWELDLPFNQAWVLLAYADHADHDGKNAFPRIAFVAWKTGYSMPSVKRIVADLRKSKILVPSGHTPGGVVKYNISLDHVTRKLPFVDAENGRPPGQIERVPRKTPY